MRQLTVTLIGVLFSFAAMGQDLLQCLNPDVVKGVLFDGRAENQRTITATLPETMAGFTAPPGFALVGSSTLPTGGPTIVAFRTNADSESAFAAMLDSFEADGWAIEEEQTSVRAIFVLDSEPVSGMICRDSLRRSLNAQDFDGQRYVTVTYVDQPSSRACHAGEPRRLPTARVLTVPTDESPILRLPAGTTDADGAGSDWRAADTHFFTGDQFRIAQSASSFMDDLGTQMGDQGWTPDTSWSGRLSQGGRWTRTAAGGFTYWATLELVDVGRGVHDLSFRLMRPPN